ncbi:MAG: TolC family protein [Planctomycetota bacterium]|nr:MAG: TolC family protein [Planctomycetota bacterium]
MILRTRLLAWIGTTLILTIQASCVQVEPKPDFEEARDLVTQSTGRAEVFDPFAPLLSEQELGAVLDQGLSLEEALRLALIHNRELQAEFQRIGVSHADWVQARLLSNPSLDLLLRFPTGGGRSVLEAIVGVQLFELWRIPLRAEVAEHNLQSTIFEVARRAGERLADTRKAYYAALAAEELLQIAQQNLDLAARSFEAIADLHSAGAADAFEETLARGPWLSAELGLRTARMEVANAKRELAEQLSLEHSVEELELTGRLPELLEDEVDTEALVKQALQSRLDLQAMIAAIEAMETHLRLENRRAWGDLAAGPAVEMASGSGDARVGPALNLRLPIFDQNQAQVVRAEFQKRQLRKLFQSARVTVAQEVRSSADRVQTTAGNLQFYRAELLPQVERSLEMARESFTAGQSPLLAVIEMQRQLLEVRRGYVSLCLEAAVAISDLERAVGAPIP